MATVNPVKKFRGTASQNAAQTLEIGTIVYLTDTKQIAVHDGSTAGGTVFDELPSQVSSGEKTAGTETAVRGFSPDDVKDMIDTHSSSPAFISYALLADLKSSGTSGGNFQSGARRDRELNTEKADPDGIVTLSNNEFTLGAGSYLIKWSAPAYDVVRHQSFLYDADSSTDIEQGSSEYVSAGHTTRSFGLKRVTIASSNSYKIRHECSSTNANGFGRAGSFGSEEYTQVEIYKEM